MDGEVAELQADLGALSAQHLKMDTMRAEERKIFATAKEDLEQGIDGIQKAAGILREYCGASFVQQLDAPEVLTSSGGAGSSTIIILDVIESDFSEPSLSEQEAESSYQTQFCEGAGCEVQAGGKHHFEEGYWRPRTLSCLQWCSFFAKLSEMCVAKAETYAERDSRRAAEIARLKEALTILSHSSLLQNSSGSQSCRFTDERSVLRRERSKFHACAPCVCGWFVGFFWCSWWINAFSCFHCCCAMSEHVFVW